MTADRFTKGDRVTGTFYGQTKTGVVVAAGDSGVVWVKWDGKRGQAWVFTESLTRVETK